MVRRCCITDCKSEWWPGTDLSFHNFPKKEEMRQKWFDAITPQRLRNTNWKYSCVCSKHFTEDCYMDSYNLTLRNTLKRDAVPSLFGEATEPEFVDLEALSDLSDEDNKEQKVQTKEVSVQTTFQKRQLEEIAEEYKRRDKNLRKRLKRAEMKIDELKAVIKATVKRSEADIIEEAILKYIPENRQDIFWNELAHHAMPTKKKYDYDIKDFAITMYLHSHEAYECLREKLTLPHPATLRKWLK